MSKCISKKYQIAFKDTYLCDFFTTSIGILREATSMVWNLKYPHKYIH